MEENQNQPQEQNQANSTPTTEKPALKTRKTEGKESKSEIKTDPKASQPAKSKLSELMGNRKLMMIVGAAAVLVIVVLLAFLLLANRGISTADYITQTKPNFTSISNDMGDVGSAVSTAGADLSFANIVTNAEGTQSAIVAALAGLPEPNSDTEDLGAKLVAYYERSAEFLKFATALQEYGLLSTSITDTISTAIVDSDIDASTPAGLRLLADHIQEAVTSVESDYTTITAIASDYPRVQALIEASVPVVQSYYEVAGEIVTAYQDLADAAEAEDIAKLTSLQTDLQSIVGKLTATQEENVTALTNARSAILTYLSSESTAINNAGITISDIYTSLSN